jgi:hypothetical protein
VPVSNEKNGAELNLAVWTRAVLHTVLAEACHSARAIRHKQLRIRRVNFHERKWVRFGER